MRLNVAAKSNKIDNYTCITAAVVTYIMLQVTSVETENALLYNTHISPCLKIMQFRNHAKN